jgi:hypothetical protein
MTRTYAVVYNDGPQNASCRIAHRTKIPSSGARDGRQSDIERAQELLGILETNAKPYQI